MARTTTLLLAHPVDPWGEGAGGVRRVVRDLAGHAPDDFRIEFVGVSEDPAARPVGRWLDRAIGGTAVRALFLREVAPGAIRGRVPLVLRFLRSWHRHRREIAQEGRILQVHRPEPLLVTGSAARRRVLVLHSDARDFRTGRTEVRWRHAPALYARLERRALARCDRVLVAQRAAADAYRAAHPDLADRIASFPAWYDEAVFRPGERSRPPGAPPTILWVGRLEHAKDPLRALEVLERLPGDAVLEMAGDGTLRGAVEARIRERGLDPRVRLLGTLAREAVAERMRRADALLLTSRSEMSPMVVPEALASGLPVVAPDVGEVAELAGRGTGAIVPGGDAASLASALRSVLATPPPAEACAAAARPYAATRVLGALYEEYRRL